MIQIGMCVVRTSHGHADDVDYYFSRVSNLLVTVPHPTTQEGERGHG
jgi:hypothetical protein